MLAFGNEIIMASSQKGKQSFVYDYPESEVKRNLEMCQALWSEYGPGTASDDGGHRTSGKCAEEMAVHLYYMKYGTTRLRTQNARIGTVVVQSDGVAEREDPCANTDVSQIVLFIIGVTLIEYPGQIWLQTVYAIFRSNSFG